MILQLHHIGVLVKDIDKAACDYVSKFGYELKSLVIHDPVQTAFVQFLRLEGDGTYLELISPDGPESKLVTALKKGGGLNHFCYQTDNIEASYQDLALKAMFILQQPVDAVAFPNRKIAWLMGLDGIPIELVEKGVDLWQKC
jgi:methylmalonyl-CoA/ethylmalonyl-CoA epimerase